MVLAAVLLVPSASAASGTLDAANLAVVGASTVSGTEDLLLLRELDDFSSFFVTAGEIRLEYHAVRSTEVKLSPVPFDVQPTTGNDDSEDAFLNVQLTVSALQPWATLIAYPPQELSGAYDVSLDTADVSMSAEPPTTVRSHDVDAGDVPYAFAYEYDRNHLVVEPHDGQITLTGDFGIYAWGVDLRLETPDGTSSFDTGVFYSNETAATSDVRRAWAYLTLTDAVLTFTVSEPGIVLHADDATIETTGTARLTDAQGTIDDGSTRYLAHGQAANLQGTLALQVAPSPSQATVLASTPPRILVGVSGSDLATNLPHITIGAKSLVDEPGEQVAAVSAAVLVFFAGYAVIHRRHHVPATVSVGARRLIPVEVVQAWIAKAESLAENRPKWVGVRRAAHLCSRGLELVPDHARLLHLRGTFYLALGRVRRAASDFTNALPHTKVPDDLAFDRAVAQARLGLADSTLDDLEVAVKAHAFNAELASRDPAFRHLANHPRFKALIKDHADRVLSDEH